ncbi:MAG: PEP-CTERM sorting domain-containing protein [Bryobacteraceae bacterium]
MMLRRRIALLIVGCAFFGLGLANAGPSVLPGWDLFETVAPTNFGGVPFQGVPLVTFDFGGGPVAVGNTDTIVQRLDQADAPSEAISTVLEALHLVSTVPTDFGLGLGFYYITLQSERGGPASPGRMTINFGAEAPPGLPHGTFDSFFDVFFDVRLGSLNGPIALSNNLLLTSQGTLWNHFPPPGAIEINGINVLLNGSNRDGDFFPLGTVSETHPTGAQHTVTTSTPEPGSLALLAFGALALLGRRAVSRRQRML